MFDAVEASKCLLERMKWVDFQISLIGRLISDAQIVESLQRVYALKERLRLVFSSPQ